MDSLFGEGTSLPVRFFIAFVVVFALIGVTAWLIRRFGSGALSGAGARGRAPRLAVIEAGAVDGRRKLVLIRRDNVEHLIMIGGPTDIVVEANIVRGQSARDNAAPASSRTSSAAEALPRAVPLDDTTWPLQPEPAPRPTRAATRPAPLEDANTWSLQPEQAPPSAPAAPAAPKQRSRASDALAGLAAELNVRPAEPAAPTLPPPAPAAPRAAPAVAAKPAAPAPAASASADNNLADMASRLEAALKRPAPAAAAAPRPAASAPRAAPPLAATPAAPVKAPEAAPVVVPPVAEKAPEPATAPEKPADNVFGSIEEEMANLLGRPAGKPS
jgi:flagellar biogenesis protein FliO